MKKTYQSPEINMVIVATTTHLLDASKQGGVETGGTLGNEFNSSDQTYSRRGGSFWDDED